MKGISEIQAGWLAEFKAVARRPLAQRMKYAFIWTYKPVLDDADYCAFEMPFHLRRKISIIAAPRSPRLASWDSY
jgi:hypothetical protein